MTPERLAEIRALKANEAVGNFPMFHYSVAIDELLAEIDALTRDNEWRKEQMENNWPRNDYGSLLTKGEYDTLKVRLTEAKSQWGIFNERLADRTIQCDQLAADMAKLREAQAEWPKLWAAFLKGEQDENLGLKIEARTRLTELAQRVLAETAPKEAE